MKRYSDQRRHAQPSRLQVGDEVLIKIPKANKMSSYYNPKPYTITTIKGTMITAACGNHNVTRNSSFFKRINRQAKLANETENNAESEDDNGDDAIRDKQEGRQQQGQLQPQQPVTPLNIDQPPGQTVRTRRYPQRQYRTAPVRLNDFVPMH